ncbi:MAG TPA: SIS domain-containing protein [Anaerolineales bacterium]|nr:SIS domain-containing protein [Anaerolineales bacterium]
MSAEKYIGAVENLIEKIKNNQLDNIHQVAKLVSEAIINEKLVFIFGAGHSSILSIECFARAGGLANMQPMLDAGLDYGSGAQRQSGFERLPGYAKCMVNDYGISAGDLVIIISNSGRNPVPVEMALEVKKLGATVVALTSLAHSNSVTSNDPSGKKLLEVADIVIDNGCPPGDAMVELPNLLPRVGPGSTVAGAVILNAIITQAAKNVLDMGIKPPVAFSGNLPEAKEYNKNFHMQREKFTRQMRHR